MSIKIDYRYKYNLSAKGLYSLHPGLIMLRMAFKQRLSKHDRYVLELRDKIRHRYDSISVNVKVAGKKRSLGEIDLVARKGRKIDLYEVKCSHRIVKARKQLNRMKRLMNMEKSGAYFYCGSSGMLVSV